MILKILDILTSPWAIQPDKMQEIRNIYQTHLRGDKIDIKAINAASPAMNMYGVKDGVAIISIDGVLTKTRSFFSSLFGGSSMRDIGNQIDMAMADTEVHDIILAIDSPGGTVDGTQELVAKIGSHRGNGKSIVAVGDGIMASAAYWIASAADKIYIANDTTSVGSIGVVATHVDVSEQDKQYGEKWTEITAGAYKRIASNHAPLTVEGREYIQSQVDHIYSVFVQSVAANRGKDSVEAILPAADGKIFIGQQAVEVGLVDGIQNISVTTNQLIKEFNMNKEEFQVKHPELFQSIVDEGRSAGRNEGIEIGKAQGKEEGMKSGAEEERERIMAIQKLSSAGNEKIVADAIADGISTSGQVAERIVLAGKARQEAQAQAMIDGAVAPVAPVESQEDTDTFEAAVDRLMKEGLSRGKAIMKVATEHEDLHKDYLKRINAR
jgi:signal peptide peptidase SppA